MFSRALIIVITCSIIFSYAVLCPQAEGFYNFVSNGPYSALSSVRPYDFLGKDILSLLNFVPETFIYYSVRSDKYAISFSDSSIVFNGTWIFSSFDTLSFDSSFSFDISFDFMTENGEYYNCKSMELQVTTNDTVLYFVDSFDIYHIVYINGHYYDIHVYFNDAEVFEEGFFLFLISTFYCIDLPAFFDSMTYYPLSVTFSQYLNDFINISLISAYPINFTPSSENIYHFPISDVFVYHTFNDYNCYEIVPFSVLSYNEYTAVDSFTSSVYTYASYDFVLDLSSFSDVKNILFFVPLPTFDTSDVGYSEAAAFISPLTIESFSSVEQAFLNSVNNVSNKLDQTNGTLNNIFNSLTDVSPEMQQSIDHLETLILDEQEKIDDVITKMDKIDTDFGTQIGDFDDILNDNAGTLEDIGSTTYNSFINDVFGNWFFVSMFALFGAFAFFSRAVFG